MENIKSITELEDLKNKYKYVLFYFSSNSCSVCHAVFPKLEKFLAGYPSIKGVKIEIDKFLSLSGEYSIFTVPVILVFREGKEIIRQGRFINFAELEDEIYKFLFRKK